METESQFNQPRRSSHRPKRAPIAAQACERCRERRIKCDEKKPRCAPCALHNLDCRYNEPFSTRMDKVDQTMAYLSNRVTVLEAKVGSLSLQSSSGTPVEPANSDSQTHPPHRRLAESGTSDHDYQIARSNELQPSRQSLSVPHRVMLWPIVRQLLSNHGWQMTRDLEHLSQQGTAWFLKRESAKHPQSFPPNDGFNSSASTLSLENEALNPGGCPYLTPEQVKEYTTAYFQTFNLVLPILEHDAFLTVLRRLSGEGYQDGDPEVVLALLVFALGKLAQEGVFGEPISTFDGFRSGFRGGDVEHPPGLHLFNQALKRLGYVSSVCTLESCQIRLLEGVYYEANAHHLEFWKSTVSASMAIQELMKCRQFEWSTHEGDMISRVYWACLLQEDLYHLDLDLPGSGIHQLEDELPLPSFHTALGQGGLRTRENEVGSHFQHHFLAMVALRRLVSRIHTTVHGPLTTRAESNEYVGPPLMVIYEMSRQLESWRSLLPRALQWEDNDVLQFPEAGTVYSSSTGPLFSLERDWGPISHESNLDILSAQLRTRFYYARYILYRPFVYKALHFPELMTLSDVDSCAISIDSMCLWPCLMVPPRCKKRVVPHLYTWTHNILGILLIMKSVQKSETLSWICENKLDRSRIVETSKLMLDWMEDAKQVDGVADWSWEVLHYLFKTDNV